MAKKNKKKKVIAKKAAVKTAKPVKAEITVKVESVAPTTHSDLASPVQDDGGKYMIPKTWVSERQVLRLVQKTPANLIRQRKGRGGMTFDYVPGSYFKKVLNFTFGWNWDFQIVNQSCEGLGETWGQVITHGRLTVKDDRGHQIIKEDFGKADIKYLKNTKTPMDLGNDYKASATDALKRCAVQLGIAGDVYSPSEFKQETGENVSYNEARAEQPTQVATLPPGPKVSEGDQLFVSAKEAVAKETDVKMLKAMLKRVDENEVFTVAQKVQLKRLIDAKLK